MEAQLPVCPDCNAPLSTESAACEPCDLKFNLSLEIGPSGAEAETHARVLEEQGIELPMPVDQFASLLERSPVRVGARQSEALLSAAMAQLQALGSPARWVVRKMPKQSPPTNAAPSEDPDRGKSDLTVIWEAIRFQGSSETQVLRTLECASGFYGAKAVFLCVVAVLMAFKNFNQAVDIAMSVILLGLTAGLLPQRRSRSLALLLLVGPLLEVPLAIHYLWLGGNLSPDKIYATNFEPMAGLIFSPAYLLVGLAAVRATFAYHRRRRSTIVWENVITTILVALGWVIGVTFIGISLLVKLSLFDNENALALLFFAMYCAFVLCFVGGVLRGTEEPRPFVRSEFVPEPLPVPEPFERLKGRQVWAAIVAGLGALSGLLSLLF